MYKLFSSVIYERIERISVNLTVSSAKRENNSGKRQGGHITSSFLYLKKAGLAMQLKNIVILFL